MAQYIVDSSNQGSETTFDTYRQTRGGIQSLAGQMYQAIARTETTYEEFDAMLADGGQFATLADYHTALQASVNDAILLLRQSMAGVMALMQQMESAMPPGTILFPGVPRNEA